MRTAPRDGIRVRRRIALTRVAWMLLGAAVGFLTGAWYLGAIELAVIGSAAIALVIASLVWSLTRPLAVSANRHVVPARPTVGGDARVEITVRNERRRTSPLYAVTDTFDDGRRAARFLVAPLPPGETGQGAYRLPTSRRGRFNLGPLSVTAHEPFGLTSATAQRLESEHVLIHPRVHPLSPVPRAISSDDVGAHVTSHFAVDADEFFSLREYVVGDELRRVHWRTSARTGRLMVREDEAVRRPACVVVLDCRRGAYQSQFFERAIEAAASVCARIAADGHPVELITGHQSVIGLDAALDHLALIEPDPTPTHFADALRHVSRRRGVIYTVAGSTSDTDAELLRATAARVGHGILVQCGPTAAMPSDATLIVVHSGFGDLAESWHQSMSTWAATTSPFAARSRR